MWVKKDGNGQLVPAAAGEDGAFEIRAEDIGASRSALEEHDREVARARKEASDAHAAQLAAERAERVRLEKELAVREKREKELALRALPPDQQVTTRLSELEQEVTRSQNAAKERERQFKKELAAVGLVAYRERAIQDVPAAVRGLVHGQDEAEINASVDLARRAYAQAEADARKALQPAQGGTESTLKWSAQPPPPAYLQAYGTPPQNPAYVQPYPQAQAGYPSVSNPAPVTEAAGTGAPLAQLQEMTSEQAVRSGRYSGELRAQILAGIQRQPGAGYQGQAGASPRHMMGQTALPGGVMQPQGSPLYAPVPPNYAPYAAGPSMPPGAPHPAPQQPPPPPQPLPPPGPGMPGYPPPGYPAPGYTPPQGPPQGPPQQPQPGYPLPLAPGVGGVDPARAAAYAAIERTHMGQNPTMAGTAGAPEALSQAQQFAAARGLTASQAFTARFADSPPVSP